MINLDLVRNLTNLIIADAKEVLPAHTDEAQAQEEALETIIRKAEKILKALEEGGKIK